MSCCLSLSLFQVLLSRYFDNHALANYMHAKWLIDQKTGGLYRVGESASVP
jgi:hypothetical protein